MVSASILAARAMMMGPGKGVCRSPREVPAYDAINPEIADAPCRGTGGRFVHVCAGHRHGAGHRQDRATPQ